MTSKEVRRLANAWAQNPWPKHLEWIEIDGLRGWGGERLDFDFPIVAIVGENGSGKSTVLQAAASIYRSPAGGRSFFASDFFPDTCWEKVRNVSIRASVREGSNSVTTSVRKPSTRWRGNPSRRERSVQYLDLRRTQPIYARTGYARLAKGNLEEGGATDFTEDGLSRLSAIIGKNFTRARQSITSLDANRQVPVITVSGQDYSGFHQGAGESTIVDLLALPLPKYGLVLIDEIETSLHPRAQRRLIRDLAEKARLDHLQIVVTTHSPYVLEELPSNARIQILATSDGKKIVRGVSPDFALTKMDEEVHPEMDVYVEDQEAKVLVEEILSATERDILHRIKITPFGAASVGKALGQMVAENRFSRPTLVVLDGDQDPAAGCHLLPGDDAPERQVFEALESVGWIDVAGRLNRSHSLLVDQCAQAMTLPDHHEWVGSVADALVLGRLELWRSMCITYVNSCLNEQDRRRLPDEIGDVLDA